MTHFARAATLRARIIAFAIDYVLISGYLIVLSLVTIAIADVADSESWARFFDNPLQADLVAFLTTVLPVALYFAFSEASSRQASWGKQRRRLRVEHTDGSRVSLGVALIRNLLKLLPWQIAHTSLFHIPGWPVNPGSPEPWVVAGLVLVWVIVLAYALSVLLRPGRQSLYDQLLGVHVVNAA